MMTMIRGAAMTWFYLCEKCKIKHWLVDEKSRVKCKLCQTKVKIPEDFVICNECAYETQMCMACGAHTKIGDDYEEMQHKALFGKVAKRKRRKTKKPRR